MTMGIATTCLVIVVLIIVLLLYMYIKQKKKRQGKSKRRFIEQKAFQMLFEKLFLMQKSDFTNLPYLLLEKEEDYETSRK